MGPETNGQEQMGSQDRGKKMGVQDRTAQLKQWQDHLYNVSEQKFRMFVFLPGLETCQSLACGWGLSLHIFHSCILMNL